MDNNRVASRTRARTGSVDFRCPTCDQGFNRQEHLTRHVRRHTREKPFRCSSCQKCFSRPDVLSRHMATHEEQDHHLTAMASPPACVDAPWSDGVGSGRGYDTYNQLGLGILDINWLSPQYQETVDLDTLSSGFAFHQTLYGTRNGGANYAETFSQSAASSEAREVISESLPTELESGAELALETVQAPSVVDAEASSTTTANRFYVDGTGARAPFGRRSHKRESISTPSVLQDPNVQENNTPNATQSVTDDILCSHAAYLGLVQAIIKANETYSIHVNVAELPMRKQIQAHVRQYFDKFHPIFPFLRKASFSEDATKERLLLLAVAAIGSKYTPRMHEASETGALFHALSATLRHRHYGFGPDCDDESDDALFVPGESARPRKYPDLRLVQAGILNVLGLLHSGKNNLVQRAHIERHYLVESCYALRLVTKNNEPRSLSTSTSSVDGWLERESRIRTGMMIWFLDSILLYTFDAKPLMALENLEVTLPSHEDIWERPELAIKGKRLCANTTLLEGMEMIYMKKRLPPDLGDFSIALLINAIYRNTMNVFLRDQFRLNSWVPTAFAPQGTEDLLTENAWLSSTSITSKWRNSACDCLDVLHWPANSKIAQHLGFEHHTILHLHLARIIILTPTRKFQAFATGLITSQRPNNIPDETQSLTRARYEVLQWYIKDECKARLAVVHAGALYWHVRRYSCDSVLEPYAIYMTTLVLWSFCLCMQLPEVMASLSNLPEDDSEPSFINLDRPIDDELVQTFVRSGHKMSAYMANIGNLQEPAAPVKILLEGISLLSKGHAMQRSAISGAYPTWGIEESYVQILRDLLGVTQAFRPATVR